MTTVMLPTEDDGPTDGGKRPVPGFLQVWTPGGPVCRVVSWRGELVLGRETPGLLLDDSRISRRHCKLVFDGALVFVEDLDSRNGTFLDGVQIHARMRLDHGQVLRIGHCLFVVQTDLRKHQAGVAVRDDMVVGGTFRAVLQQASARAAAGEPLLLVGPSGAGKLLVARHFHGLAGDGGPFVHVSPGRVADSPEAAIREAIRAGVGTLLIAGVEELGAAAQGLLLPLCEPGARPRLCVLARADLRPVVRHDRLREDLYFRLHSVQVEVPPLTRRVEEVAFHIHHELAAFELQAQALLVEHCVRLPWPGNVRELRAELRAAAVAAQEEGLTEVAPCHLRPDAGAAESTPMIVSAARLGDPASVYAAIRAEGGNVRAAARVLGVHRNQLRRWLDQRGLKPHALPDALPDADDPST